MKKSIFLLLFAFLCNNGIFAMKIYVNASASGNNTGLSWTDAYNDLQSAISLSTAGDEIWVAAGNYKPTSGGDRTISFILKSGVKLYGGFNGTETLLAQRDYTLNTTILNGDIGQLGLDTDNTIHLITCSNGNTQTRIDGFRIINAYAYDANSSHTYGGGMNLTGTSAPVIANCSFLNNYAQTGGSAIEIVVSSANYVEIDNCYFAYNFANGIGLGGGGGAVSLGDGNVSIKNSSFIFNTGNDGGAIHASNGNCRIDKCIIAGNSTIGISYGAGILAEGLSSMNIYNSLIIGNQSESSPALYFDQITVSNIVNCTFAHNSKNSTSTSSALTFNNSFGNPSLSSFRNNIVWENSSPQITSGYGSIVSNSIIQGGYTNGANILTSNPNFLLPSALNAAPFDTTGVNYRVGYSSPAVNAGNNTYISATYNKDLDGITRPFGSIVDMGAYELSYCNFQPTLFASGPTTFCQGGSVVLSVGANAQSQTWTSGITTPSINVIYSGNYSVSVIDTNGCIGTASQQVTVITPNISISGPFNICEGDTITLSATGGLNYAWSTGDTSLTIQASTAGTISLIGTSVEGCLDTAYKVLQLKPKPTPNIQIQESSGVSNNDGIICEGASINLTASGGNSYLWSTGVSGNTLNLSPTTSQDYYVKVTNGFGCYRYSDTLQVVVMPLPNVSFAFMDTVSYYAPTFSLTGGLPLGGTYSGVAITNNSLSPQATTLGYHSITYTYTDVNACTNSAMQSYYMGILTSTADAIQPQITLFPNPAKHILYVENAQNQDFAYKIVDIWGHEYAKGILTKTNEINIDKLATGIYWLEIEGFYIKWIKE